MAAAALEEQRSTPTREAEVAAEARVAPLPVQPLAVPEAPSRRTASRLVLGTVVLVETGWLGVLGFLAYRLFT